MPYKRSLNRVTNGVINWNSCTKDLDSWLSFSRLLPLATIRWTVLNLLKIHSRSVSNAYDKKGPHGTFTVPFPYFGFNSSILVKRNMRKL